MKRQWEITLSNFQRSNAILKVIYDREFEGT